MKDITQTDVPPLTTAAGRLVATACLAGGMFVLAGCSTGPDIAPIFKVAPPAQQQTNCLGRTGKCMPRQQQPQPSKPY